MTFREWIADNIGYKLYGCSLNRHHDDAFDFIERVIPRQFYSRKIHDLGCGDGKNTSTIRRIFQAKSIIGVDRHRGLLERARKRGIQTKQMDLNHELPKGELATFTYSLHHVHDKVTALRVAKINFTFLFLCEPVKDLCHTLFDAGDVQTKKVWIKLFDSELREYRIHQYKNNLIVFWQKPNGHADYHPSRQ